MAGILVNSASKTMTSGDESADNQVSGFVIDEQITLQTTPTGTNYAWTLTKPVGSVTAALDDDDAAAPKFNPDVEGVYLVTADVDGTVYVIRITVVDAAISNSVQIHRMTKVADAAVPTPSTGALNSYFSEERNMMVTKNSVGDIRPWSYYGSVGTDLTDGDESVEVGDGNLRWLLVELTATRTKTLSVSGAANGNIVTFIIIDDGAVDFTNDGPGGGTTSITVPSIVSFKFDGTNWGTWESTVL